MALTLLNVLLSVGAMHTAFATPTCPCPNQTLCNPITRSGPENVYAFHTTGALNWRSYDWSIITTVCVFGQLDPELLCHAHANNARVTFGTGGLDVGQWRNASAISGWVNKSVGMVVDAFADGFNIDIEHSASDPADITALTALTKQAVDAMHKVNPHSHVTFDVPSEGLLQEGCGTQYGRAYDFAAMAEVVDFFVVMDYDSNDAHHAVGTPQEFLPRSAPDYIYDNRSSAEAACVAANYSRLCTKAEIKGYTKCAFGWCSDYEGYWMDTAMPGCGSAGYNDHTGPAGAFCCAPMNAAPCPTCFFANAALPVVQAGVSCYKSLGVPANKLVLAFPWYGYDYTCSATSSLDTCQVTAAQQLGYPAALALLEAAGTVTGWLDNSSTPYLGYHTKDGTLHRVDYDNSKSLLLKYAFAREAGALGVGMWTASTLNYNDTKTASQFWADLKTFRPNLNEDQA
eukprot:m.251329 g.251329  ORF g.251329 m.251329 type:complete len:457 (+) comp33893_c2_seq14:72-1442(+)